jgi:flagellar motor switch/type III secretory pathway protein FliN
VVRFTVADLLALAKGSIVETACHHTSDVPLRVNNLLIGWTEFEVVGDRLAVRITDLA